MWLGRCVRDALIELFHNVVAQVGSLVEGRLGVANLCLLQLLHLLLDLYTQLSNRGFRGPTKGVLQDV